MIALSFLGVGNYEETDYKYQNRLVRTKHFSYAVSEFVKPSKLFVIMTEKAEKTHSESLKKLCDFEPIKIPEGKSEDEFWIIFDKITEVVNDNEEIVFDITHGFRSLPFLIIVLLLYLKVLKNITINNILYGAFEAKDENNITPVFELKHFVDLIEWSNAVREFTENGNMKYFNILLSEIHRNSYLNNLPNPSKQLKGAGEDLSKLTDAFATIRLKEILQNTSHFNRRVEKLKIDFKNNPKAKPFGNLINKITEQFEVISKAEGKIFSEKGFEAQKSILRWYVETNKYQKALTLAREYITSKYLLDIMKKSVNQLVDYGLRESAAKELGEIKELIKNGKVIKGKKGEYGRLWLDITRVRNDINHASMNKNPTSSKDLINSTIKIIRTIIDNF